MSDPSELHLVRVIMTDFIVAGSPVPSTWIAAVPRDNAAEAVARAIPANWTAELIEAPVSSGLRALIFALVEAANAPAKKRGSYNKRITY